jgi:energy-coupling factor transport system substrate-specific component
MPQHSTSAQPTTVIPEEFGVGARFSLHPMADDFVRVILDALGAADHARLTVSTDDVSTYVTGAEADIIGYLTDVIGAAARSGVHTVAHVLLSRGCPGEITCEPAGGAALVPQEFPQPPRTGLQAAAHWSLYPLDDGDRGNHLAVIGEAIENAKARGTFTRAEHYATRLDGDLADVLATVCGGWLLAGRSVRHVTSHATISLNSPTTEAL